MQDFVVMCLCACNFTPCFVSTLVISLFSMSATWGRIFFFPHAPYVDRYFCEYLSQSLTSKSFILSSDHDSRKVDVHVVCLKNHLKNILKTSWSLSFNRNLSSSHCWKSMQHNLSPKILSRVLAPSTLEAKISQAFLISWRK